MKLIESRGACWDRLTASSLDWRGLRSHAVDQGKQLFARADVQFSVDVSDVGARSVVGYEQRFGNVDRAVSQAQVLQDLVLALGESVLVSHGCDALVLQGVQSIGFVFVPGCVVRDARIL